MQLFTATNAILDQLADLITQLSDEDFAKPVKALSHSTIGQHMRHTLEFFICLEQGYANGLVNYDKRTHNKMIEADRFLALHTIQKIKAFIVALKADQSLHLEVGYGLDADEMIRVDTNYFRELIYNIEHAVHHMAIMKIGIKEVAPHVSLAADFGIAASTLRYKRHESLLQRH
jgi:uncharacterized damage-inducible protein DinB